MLHFHLSMQVRSTPSVSWQPHASARAVRCLSTHATHHNAKVPWTGVKHPTSPSTTSYANAAATLCKELSRAFIALYKLTYLSLFSILYEFSKITALRYYLFFTRNLFK